MECEFLVCCLSSLQSNAPRQYPVVTVNEPLGDRYYSPHPFYQGRQTENFYQRVSTSFVPTLNPTAPLDKRKTASDDSPPAASRSKKGKQKQRSNTGGASSSPEHGKNPLEIAYGPVVGTSPTITEDDFEVDTADIMHKPQPAPEQARDPAAEISPIEEEEGEWEDSGGRGNPAPPSYGIGDEDEFRNVWGK